MAALDRFYCSIFIRCENYKLFYDYKIMTNTTGCKLDDDDDDDDDDDLKFNNSATIFGYKR